MIVKLSSDAERDIAEGYRFYEGQANGLGSYFRDCVREHHDPVPVLAMPHEPCAISHGFAPAMQPMV